MPEGTWKINKFLTSKIAQPIQATFFNVALHTLYNSSEGVARAFFERINTADMLGKNYANLAHVHSFIQLLAATTQKEERYETKTLRLSLGDVPKSPNNGRNLGLTEVRSEIFDVKNLSALPN